MGYYTDFTLTVTTKTCRALDAELVQELLHDLRLNCEEARWSIEPDGTRCNESKWYEHEKDLKDFSSKHPLFLFTLHGEGEETGDVYNKYFVNGLMQHEKASMKINPFDPAKLK